MTKVITPSWSWYPRPISKVQGSSTSPVFVTGIPRCGSSWVGEILSSCQDARYVYEPFNFQWMTVLRDQVRHFRYLTGQSDIPPLLQGIADGAFRGRQGRKQILRAAYRGYLRAACRNVNRIIVKDPTASLMSEWIAKKFHAQVLVVIRHPCGFASSMEKLGWPLNVNVLLGQKELMRDYLSPFKDTLRSARNDKWLTRGAIWGAIHLVFARQLERNADWHLVRFEDLCNDPIGQYETLISKLGLEQDSRTRAKIRALSTSNDSDPGSTQRESSSMPDIWQQRMSADEIDAVLGIVKEFGLEYYVE